MSIKQIECMVAVTKSKSFTKAAKRLKITQPSLSQSIAILENQVGMPLFDRTTSPITLTNAGELYYLKANTIIDLYKELTSQMSDISNFKTGNICIGISQIGYYFIPETLPKFSKLFPNVKLKIIQAFSNLHLKKMLLNGDIDIATLILPIDKNKFNYKIIKEDKVLLVLPSNHPLSIKAQKTSDKYPSIALNELKDEKFILPRSTLITSQVFDEVFHNAGFKPNILCEAETYDIANSIVASGMGVCFTLPQFLTSKYNDKLTLFNINEPLLKCTLTLAYRKDKRLSKIAREFLAIAKNC